MEANDIKIDLNLDEMISEYQVFLKENLNSNDITNIASSIMKTPMTVYNHLDTRPDVKGKNKAKDFLTMKAIVEIGLSILIKRGISK